MTADLIQVETSTGTRTHAPVPRGLTAAAYFVRVYTTLEPRRLQLTVLKLPFSHLLRLSCEAYFPLMLI
jgi:hypothetical protein